LGEMSEGQCSIQFELGGAGGGSFAGEYLWFTLDDSGVWRCSGTLADKDLPSQCRD